MAEEKKLLEKSPINGIAVPIAIVLVGALIIFGVTKMLSTDRSYKDLVYELESKTFGNRWVAAFELSKVISAQKVKSEDKEWLLEKLKDIYNSSNDARTREFLIVTLGSLKDKSSIPIFEEALKTESKEGKFHALVALSRQDLSEKYDWQKIYNLLNGEDEGLAHAAIFILVSKNAPEAKEKIEPFLTSSNSNLRYAAATSLLSYKVDGALPVVKEILSIEEKSEKYDPNKTQALKLNILGALQRNPWNKLAKLVEEISVKDKDLKVNTRAISVLKRIKN